MKTLNLRIQKQYVRNGRPAGSFTEVFPALSISETADRLWSEGVETSPQFLYRLIGKHTFIEPTAQGQTFIDVSAIS